MHETLAMSFAHLQRNQIWKLNIKLLEKSRYQMFGSLEWHDHIFFICSLKKSFPFFIFISQFSKRVYDLQLKFTSLIRWLMCERAIYA